MAQATSFDSILVQCRDLVCDRLALALAGMLDKANDTLSALIRETRDQKTQKLYLETRDKVHAQREAIETQFRTRYLREFQARSNRVKKIGDSFSEIDVSSLELELVGEEDLNETLKFNAMAARLHEYCDEELIALDQRVGVLVGDASLQAEDNPFNPQAICDAYKQTCRQIDSNVDVRMVLLKLFDDHVLDDIRAIYKAVNALLVQNEILPKIRTFGPAQRSRGKAPPAAAVPGTAERGSVAPAVDKVPGGEQDFFTVLQNLLASNVQAASQTGAAGGTVALPEGTSALPGSPAVAGLPGTGGGVDSGRAVLQGAELLRSLTRIQLGDLSSVTGGSLPLLAAAGEAGTTNIIRELKGTSLGSGMKQVDIVTLDIMAMLFDQLFDDPKIPLGVKGLIGRLQIPMLKVAIADKSFFSRKTHPARQMLDTLGEISSRLPAEVNASDSLFGRLESILQEIIDGFEDDFAIFDIVRERLQTLITEEDQRVEQETLSAAKEIEQKESLALAKAVAQAQIKVRLRASKAPRAVIRFLVQQWLKVLLLVQVKDGEGSDAWNQVLETMDLLLWSVEPRETLEERRELVATVPELLKRLADGLNAAGVEDSIRTRFFADLRKLHFEIIDKAAKARTVITSEEAEIVGAPHYAGTANDAPIAEVTPIPESGPAPTEAVQPVPTLPVELPAGELGLVPKEAAQQVPTSPLEPAGELGLVPKEGVESVSTPPVEPVAGIPGPGPREAIQPVMPSPVEQPPETPEPVHGDAIQQAPVLPVGTPAPVEVQALDSESLDFTAPVTVRNPFGGGHIRVDDLDVTATSGGKTAVAKPDTDYAAIPESLSVGTWVEIREKSETDTRTRAKLSFITPLKTRYLFVNRQGKTVLECSRAELARRFRLGEVAVSVEVPEVTLFDRIADGLLGRLGGSKAPS